MQLTSHKVNPANDKLDIYVSDKPGAGGAHHLYSIFGFNTSTNASDPYTDNFGEPATHTTVLFQNGPIDEVGVNGITHEALLAILIHRMECFQAGPYASRENALALTKLQEAQMWLLERTRGRVNRGVEGTHEM